MKAKYALMAILAVVFFGCDDNTAGLGLNMLPDSDQNMTGKLTHFDVTSRSIKAGDIYAKTNLGYVGQFTDEEFGTYEAGFLASINCPKTLSFPGIYTNNALNKDGKIRNNMVGADANAADLKDITLIKDENGKVIGNIHTVEIYFWYNSFFGDSATTCGLSVYELNKKLDKKQAYYTSINPSDYYNEKDPKALLGKKMFTGVDFSLSDSIRNLPGYTPYVHLYFDQPVAERVGGDIMKAARKAGSSFDYNQFSDIFKGIYVKNDFGDGTVLYIDQVEMNVVYKCYVVDEVTGVKLKKKNSQADSTYFDSRSFTSTREVIQANHMSNNEEKIKELIAQTNNTYLKSPAGIFTEAEIPVSKVYEQLQADTLNAVKLSFFGYNSADEHRFGMNSPSTVMLIRKKYKDSFFIKNELANNKTSYLTNFNKNSCQYSFNNITNLINDCLSDGERDKAEKTLREKGSIRIETTDAEGKQVTYDVTNMKDWEKYSDWNKVVLIPVLVSYDQSSYQNQQIISVQHDLKPSYIRLKGGIQGEQESAYKLKLEVISTNISNQ